MKLSHSCDPGTLPFWMLLISFTPRVELIRSQLNQSFVKFTGSPVEPIFNQFIILKGVKNSVYLGYELSPSPKVVNWTSSR